MDLFSARDSRPVHFVGVAGAGMSALALLARSRGAVVTGCDLDPTGAPDLERAGVAVQGGHSAEHVSGARAVVVSSAIPADHPELVRARLLAIPIVRRAEALASVISGSQTLAVAGTHGKTTTTVMLTEALAAAGRNPTGIAGGRVSSWGGNARLGDLSLCIVEADEYDRSFLALEPAVAVVTNIEPDHLECYDGRVDRLEDAFQTFAERAERLVVNVDDRGARRLAERVRTPVWRVSEDPAAAAEVRISRIERTPAGSSALLTIAGEAVQLSLSVPGQHNVRNAAQALAVVGSVGADLQAAACGLAAFQGVGRRFQGLGSAGGVEVVDDYAHHPTEITATIDAARQRYPTRRLVVVFQPHLFSRTQRLGIELGRALAAADLVRVASIYPARESPIPGVTGALVAQRAGRDARYTPERNLLVEELLDLLRPEDLLLTLGAGDITTLGPEILQRLSARSLA